MQITRLWLTDFRSYTSFEVDFDLGLTAIIGPNGVGKTNLLEALGVLATLKSFRSSPTDSMVRRGAESAVVRAEGIRDGRDVLIEVEVGRRRTRAQVNRQRLKRARDLLGALRITVFAPDDLALIKEGPAVRREYLDDLAVALDPTFDATLRDLERILKQRNALLRQSRGQLDEAAAMTLDVWDTKLAATGEAVMNRRLLLVDQLVPLAGEAYDQLAAGSSRDDSLSLAYQRSWSGDSLAVALGQAREDDVRRGVSTVGPHRDELFVGLNGLTARTEASQGEQRTLALALRLAGHRMVSETLGEPPLLLLDDVLSELDDDRARALLSTLPPGQTVITSATELPALAVPDRVFRLDEKTESPCG